MKSKHQNFGMVGRDILPHLRQVEKIATRKQRIDNALVIVGLFFVTVATFPSLVNVVVYGGTPPPATLTGGVCLGLIFYLIRALRNFKTLWGYAIGETIGIISNGTLLALALMS